MKKVLALLAVAALVGVLISTGDGGNTVDEKKSSPPARSHPKAKSTLTETPNPEAGVREVSTGLSPAPATPSEGTKKASTEQERTEKEDPSGKSGPGPAPRTSTVPSATKNGPSGEKSAKKGVEAWLAKARDLAADGQRAKARRILTERYLNSRGKEREAYQKLLDQINEKLIWDPSCKEGGETYRLQSGDTLGKVARKYDINWRMIARLNGIENPARIRAGEELKILTGKPSVLVTKEEFTLTLLIDDYYVKEYPVGIGKNDKTPTGEFTVDNCLIEPDWYKPSGGVVKYGEKGHLLGDRWLGFEDKPGVTGYGIHGTNDPESVGTKCSQGCVRLRNGDVRELYDFITPGTKVKIVE